MNMAYIKTLNITYPFSSSRVFRFSVTVPCMSRMIVRTSIELGSDCMGISLTVFRTEERMVGEAA